MLKRIGLSWSRYRDWKRRFGMANNHNGRLPREFWLEPWEVLAIVNFKKNYPEIGYRRLSYMMLDENVVAVSPSTTYRVLSLYGLTSHWKNSGSGSKRKGFAQPIRPHEHWHTDISYINFHGTFLFLISVLDGFSRFIVHHELRTNMQEYDVQVVLQRALEKYPHERPRLITDNGSQFLALDFKKFLRETNLTHVRTSVNHPQANGKIEAWHKTIKNECIRQESLLSLKDARRIVGEYIEDYNYNRLHSAIGYIAPYDKLCGKAESIFKERDQRLEEARKRRRQNWQKKKQDSGQI
jgi:transposase InsO family protein